MIIILYYLFALQCLSNALEIKLEAFSMPKVDCGSVEVCGVLVLQSGFGPKAYKHSTPQVHGLWPQTDNYGSSKCFPPEFNVPYTQISTCYNQEDNAASANLKFQQHEWDAHGKCAGTKDQKDYFTQVCSLSSQPLTIMTRTRQNNQQNGNPSQVLNAMVNDLKHSGYDVLGTDSVTYEIALSACLDAKDEKWKLASIADFPRACGGYVTTDDDVDADLNTIALDIFVFALFVLCAYGGWKYMTEKKHSTGGETHSHSTVYNPILGADSGEDGVAYEMVSHPYKSPHLPTAVAVNA